MRIMNSLNFTRVISSKTPEQQESELLEQTIREYSLHLKQFSVNIFSDQCADSTILTELYRYIEMEE